MSASRFVRNDPKPGCAHAAALPVPVVALVEAVGMLRDALVSRCGGCGAWQYAGRPCVVCSRRPRGGSAVAQ